LEHHSILYGPVNRLLIRLLGEPPVEKMSPGAAAFWFPDGKEAWIPDAAIMTLLLLLLFLVFFPMAARKYRRERPGGVQNFLEMIVDAIRGLIDDVIGHGAEKKYLNILGTFAIFIFAANLFGPSSPPAPPGPFDDGRLASSSSTSQPGFREHGFGYLRHGAGVCRTVFPSRDDRQLRLILSLSLRLFMNIYGEHTATGISPASPPRCPGLSWRWGSSPPSCSPSSSSP
jgi:F-type H+-transporting ATPase subunit a